VVAADVMLTDFVDPASNEDADLPVDEAMTAEEVGGVGRGANGAAEDFAGGEQDEDSTAHDDTSVDDDDDNDAGDDDDDDDDEDEDD